jgi:LPXTG-site transpeptidase (sortase) family protein
MANDQQSDNTTSQVRPGTTSIIRRWLSTGLIVAGLLMLAGGGIMAYETLVVVAVPPPPLGLDENPLPVVTDSALPTAEQAAYNVSTPTLIPTAETTGPLRGAQDTLTGPPPSPTATPIPPAVDPPTRIVASAINLDARVVPVGWKEIEQDGHKVSVWEVAEYAAGWHKNSALPGQQGNVVLSGHHNIKGEVFRYVVDLKPGDAITLYADERPYTYTVVSRFVLKDKGEPAAVREQNARWIGPFPDKRLTLVTCWPYTSNTHRVIVVAKPAP